MADIIKSIQDFGQAISGLAETLFSNPVFWFVLFSFCIILFMNAKGKSKSASQQHIFSKGIKKLISYFTDIFLDLFNSIFDAIGVVLNFIKELNSLLFGSLHEARAYRLAGFGVVFLSSVSFWTTSQGLASFIGVPFNYFISFGVQSAILIVDFKIVKDFKQRKDIMRQIQKTHVNAKEHESDTFFSWENSLNVRFKKCRGYAEKMKQIVMKNAPNATVLLEEIEKLLVLFSRESSCMSLFADGIDVSQLDSDMQTLFSKMESAASSASNPAEARRNAVEHWLSDEFREINTAINASVASTPEAQKALNPYIEKIRNSLLDIRSNFQKFIMMPKAVYRKGANWLTRIWNNGKSYKNVEAFRYSSGEIKEFHTRWHFFGLSLALAMFVFLSSTFSFSYIYNTTFENKRDFENYHMTIKMCDDAVMNYQHNILDMSNISKDKINEFIGIIQNSASYDTAANAYTNYYADEENSRDINNKIAELDPNDPNAPALLVSYNNQLSKSDDSKAKNKKGKALYQEYLALIEIFSQTPFASSILGGTTAPIPPTAADANYAQKIKEYDKASAIWTNKGLVTTTENIISKLSSEYRGYDWRDIRDRVLIYQNIIYSVEDFETYQATRKEIINGTYADLNGDASEYNKSLTLLNKTTDFSDIILARFGAISQDDVVAFCDSLYVIKSNVSDQERFVNEKTANVEKATTMLFSKFVPTGIPLFCWFIAVLIDISIFVILFVRGIKNRAQLLNKLKVLLAKLLLKSEESQQTETISPLTRSIILVSTLAVSIVVTFFFDIPYVSTNRGWMFFAIWFVLYMITDSFTKLAAKQAPYASQSGLSYKEKVDLIDSYYSHLFELLARDFGQLQMQISNCDQYENLLIGEFPKYTLHITDDFRVLKSNITQNTFTNIDGLKHYLSDSKLGLMNRVRGDILEDYVNEMCSDFLKSLIPGDAKEYGGFNYLFHKALDKCNDRERLFGIYYESLYPTLLYIPYDMAVQKGFHVLLNLLAGEDLAYYDDGNIYIAPLFFRILDEILYLKMIDEDFDFTEGDDNDTNLGMDDVVEAYVEAKYSNSQE